MVSGSNQKFHFSIFIPPLSVLLSLSYRVLKKKHLFTQDTCCYPAFLKGPIPLEDVLFFYLERSAMPTLAHVK